LIDANKKDRFKFQAFYMLNVKDTHIAFLANSLPLMTGNNRNIVFDQGDVESLGQWRDGFF